MFTPAQTAAVSVDNSKGLRDIIPFMNKELIRTGSPGEWLSYWTCGASAPSIVAPAPFGLLHKFTPKLAAAVVWLQFGQLSLLPVQDCFHFCPYAPLLRWCWLTALRRGASLRTSPPGKSTCSSFSFPLMLIDLQVFPGHLEKQLEAWEE